MSDLTCIVVTPEKTALEQAANFIALPLFDGEIGIMPGHSPMIGRLGYGEMRIQSKDKEPTKYYVDGGFVQVAGNVVSVLTNLAMPASEVDGEAASKKLDEAMRLPAHTDDLLDIRDRQIAQARAQIRAAS